jgi:mono/diheme cytochrome c family protein
MKKSNLLALLSLAIIINAALFWGGASAVRAAAIDAKALYSKHCKSCHGEDGKPTDLGAGLEARDFTDANWQSTVTDEKIIKQINEGTPEKMMPFKEKLNQE